MREQEEEGEVEGEGLRSVREALEEVLQQDHKVSVVLYGRVTCVWWKSCEERTNNYCMLSMSLSLSPGGIFFIS